MERMQNSVREAYGLGDSNAHCGTGLGERNALRECIIACGKPMGLETPTFTAAPVWGSGMDDDDDDDEDAY